MKKALIYKHYLSICYAHLIKLQFKLICVCFVGGYDNEFRICLNNISYRVRFLVYLNRKRLKIRALHESTVCFELSCDLIHKTKHKKFFS